MKRDVDEDFFPIDLKFDEFDWPRWGTDSDWSLTTMNEGT